MTKDQLKDAWNALCAAHPGKLKPVCTFRPSWEPMLSARMKDPVFVDNWREAMQAIPRSPFIMGENREQRAVKYRNWQPNMEWFLRQDTVYKLVDGDYGEAQAAEAGDFDAWK